MVAPTRESAPRSTPGDRLGPWLLALATLLGGLRLYELGSWSLWIDEAFTWVDAHHADSMRNPLGYLAIQAVVELCGGRAEEWVLRLLPAIAGWLVVPLAYWAFLPLVGGLRAGVVSLVLAVSSWQLYWSQNARFYTLAELLSLLGGALVLRSFLQGGVRRAVVGAALVGISGLFHPSGLLMGAVVIAPLLLRLLGRPLPEEGRAPLRALLLCIAVAALPGLYWSWDVWNTYMVSKSLETGLGGRLQGLMHFVLATGFYITPLLGAAFLVGAVLCWRSRLHVDSLVLAAAVLPLLFAALAALFARVTAQYVFVLSPWIVLLCTVPLARAFSRISGRLAFATLLVLPLMVDASIYLTERRGERERWREAWLHVLENRRPGDLVAGMAAPVGELYLDPGATDLRHPRQVTWLDAYRAHVPESWSPFARRSWFVIREDSLVTWQPEERASFRAMLREECRLSARFPVSVTGRELAVEVYVRE